MISIGKLKSNASTAGGYLQSENVFSSSSTSADSEVDDSSEQSATESETGETSAASSRKKRNASPKQRRAVQRSYDIASVAGIDALIVSHLDDDDEYNDTAARSRPHSRSSTTSTKDHNTNTSSDNASSASSSSSSESVDSDDTGTIADRRPKNRHFSKVFVVNRVPHGQRGGSSTENDSQSSDANLEDSSDNDTDTERTDCGIVLHSVKVIHEEDGLAAAADLVAVVNESDSTATTSNDDDDDDESECDNSVAAAVGGNSAGKYVATSADEIANCIVVVGGITDDDDGGVVLHAVRLLGDEELEDVRQQSNERGTVSKKVANAAQKDSAISAAKHAKHAKQSEQLNMCNSSASEQSAMEAMAAKAITFDLGTSQKVGNTDESLDAAMDTEEACEELHSISNDVNRLLALHKQNSQLELKLQKFRRDVAQINEDHLSKSSDSASTSPANSSPEQHRRTLKSSIEGECGLKLATADAKAVCNDDATKSDGDVNVDIDGGDDTPGTVNVDVSVGEGVLQEQKQSECNMTASKNSSKTGIDERNNESAETAITDGRGRVTTNRNNELEMPAEKAHKSSVEEEEEASEAAIMRPDEAQMHNEFATKMSVRNEETNVDDVKKIPGAVECTDAHQQQQGGVAEEEGKHQQHIENVLPGMHGNVMNLQQQQNEQQNVGSVCASENAISSAEETHKQSVNAKQQTQQPQRRTEYKAIDGSCAGVVVFDGDVDDACVNNEVVAVINETRKNTENYDNCTNARAKTKQIETVAASGDGGGDGSGTVGSKHTTSCQDTQLNEQPNQVVAYATTTTTTAVEQIQQPHWQEPNVSLSEACKTNELSGYFMDSLEQAHTTATTTTPLAFTESEQERKTPEQIVYTRHANTSTSYTDMPPTIRTTVANVGVADGGDDVKVLAESQKQKQVAINKSKTNRNIKAQATESVAIGSTANKQLSVANAGAEVVCAALATTATNAGELANSERLVENEMLNDKDESEVVVAEEADSLSAANTRSQKNTTVKISGNRNTDTPSKYERGYKQRQYEERDVCVDGDGDGDGYSSGESEGQGDSEVSDEDIFGFRQQTSSQVDFIEHSDEARASGAGSSGMVNARYAPCPSVNTNQNDNNNGNSVNVSGSTAPTNGTKSPKYGAATSLSAKYRSLIMITKDNSTSNNDNNSSNSNNSIDMGSSETATTSQSTTKYSENAHTYKTTRATFEPATRVIQTHSNDEDSFGASGGSVIRLSYETSDPNRVGSAPTFATASGRTNFPDLNTRIDSRCVDDSSSPDRDNINNKVTLAYDTSERDHYQVNTVEYGIDQDNENNDNDNAASNKNNNTDDYDDDAADGISDAMDSTCSSKTKAVCLEDGLADDDSWVEEISQHGEEEFIDDTTPTASDSEDLSIDGDDTVAANCMFIDREEELRGYHRSAIDFTLHTIVEESCEESEVASLRDNDNEDSEELDDTERRRQRTINHHNRMSASDLEKYFFFGLGDGKVMSSIDTRGDDTASEVSSECSEGLDSLGVPEEPVHDINNAAELASSRLEKYFLSGFMGFSASDKNESDESGSVGSDSEGHPSPSQRRKRLVRARGTPRSHNSSLDNLLVDAQAVPNDSLEPNILSNSNNSDLLDSSESETCDETVLHVSSGGERTFDNTSTDTIKRKKQVRKRHDSLDEKKMHESTLEDANKLTTSTNMECRTPTPGSISSSQAKKQQHHSRDSGFVGSNDDLLKAPECEASTSGTQTRTKSPTMLEQIEEVRELPQLTTHSTLPLTAAQLNAGPSTSSCLQPDGLTAKPPLPPVANAGLVRKDSFNNWSSDEETNLMMSKMRQFFKTLVVATANAQQNYGSANNSKGPTPNQTTPISVRRMKTRPAQLAYFENELTRLMKTVPGINDEQVREIVEYLSSEDTWSDSCDSSDYTSSDLEGSARKKVELKEQISASCQQIINKFEVDEEGDRGDGGLLEMEAQLNPDAALVYQKLVASFSKIAVGNTNNTTASTVAMADGASTNTEANEAIKPVEEDQISTGSTQSAERSPQLFAKVMQHIGTRLVALMHEVNSGNDSHGTNSPIAPTRHHHKRLQAKISITTTEDEEESQTEYSQVKSARGTYQQQQQQQQHYSHHHTLHQTKLGKLQDDANNLARSKSHDLLLDSASTAAACSSSVSGSSAGAVRPHHHQSSSGVSDTAGEECGVASDYERFSWRGSFESALLANGDSRTKLSQLDRDNSSSASALAVAKRRSAGDLLFNHKSMSREQLDRVRSCGSIGGGDERHKELEASPAKPWVSSVDSKDVRRSSVPDAIYESDSSDEDAFGARSTLPRSLAGVTQVASTNSLPRLPTSSSMGAAAVATSTPMTKSQSALNFTPTSSAKSARYRSPGLASRASASLGAKKASSTLGLQHFLYSKRDARKRLNLSAEEAKAAAEELNRSPVIGQRNEPASSPIHSRGSNASDAWPAQSDEDIDRLVALHQNRDSLSSLGLRSDSMASVYSGAGEGRYGTVAVKGQVEFAMQYNYKLGALEIHVVRCKDLAAVDAKRNRSDPYVKVYLLPDKSKAGKRKTKVKKHTLNPIFDEILRFHMPISSLESRTLWLTVWHSDMFGRNDFLGEVSVNLQGKVFDNPQSQWYLLQERSEPFDEIATYRGDIVVGLKFIPPESVKPGFMRTSSTSSTGSNLRKFGSIKSVTSRSDRTAKGGQLHVLVKEAKHLSPIKANGTCDAFCKSYLLPDRTRSSKQKTPVVKRSLNPTWNYTFIYEDVSLDDLSERALELTVWDHDRLASNEFLGGVRFSLGTGKSYGRQVDWMDATGKELSLWQNMLDRPNFWVEGSVILRSTLDGIRAIP